MQNASKTIDCVQKACIMVRYISEKQLTIEEFKTPFQQKLSADNRWVKLSQVVPWDEFASAYMSMMVVARADRESLLVLFWAQ